MANENRRRGGWLAKRRGEFFETSILITARRQGIEVLDIPDGCIQRSATMIQRVPTPFDYVIAKHPRMAAFFDAKTTEASTYSYSAIDQRQLNNLKAMANCGFPAGYLVHHRGINRVVFYSVDTMMSIGPRESLSPKVGMDLGHESDFDLRRLLNQQKAEDIIAIAEEADAKVKGIV